MKRPEGRQPTNLDKHREIEANMDEIGRLKDRNAQLELEIRLERMTGKVVSMADHIAAKKLLNAKKQRRPQHLAAS